jgi:DNA-binding response OmpR family regulator
VAEDADGIRSLIRSVIEREKIEVTEARDGQEALDLLRAGRYDLVVLDLMMPGVSGYRVLEALKSQWPDTPCIVVTAAGEVGLSVLDPSIPVLRKPFELSRLIELVRGFLPRNSKAT